MTRVSKKTRGQSAIEFAAVIMFLLATFIVFQKYIVRGFSGRWHTVGDGLGQGRIYDPNMTRECASNIFFQEHVGNPPVWYDQRCFEAQCERHCLQSTRDAAACWDCMTNTCQTPYCD